MVLQTGSGLDQLLQASFMSNVSTVPETTAPATTGFVSQMINAAQCLAGYYCPKNSSNMVVCPAGYYCPAGSGAPIPCAVGTYCPQGSAAPKPCSAGHYCPEKSWKHALCPIGFYCPSGSATPVRCTAGYFCPEGSMAQTICPASYYCPIGTALPVPCSVGNMCPTSGLATQQQCPDGSYSYTKSTKCIPCLEPPNGTVDAACQLTCNDGYTKVGWRCLPPWQFTSTDTGVPMCPPCYSMTGNMCALSTTCTPTCTIGYTLNAMISTCTPCSAGTYTNNTGQCVPCGSDSTSTPGSHVCTCLNTSPYPNTSYVWNKGSNSCSLLCDAGYYRGSATTCTQCPANTYCPQGAASPAQCPTNTYSVAGSEFCTFDTGVGSAQCPAGTWASESENMCRLCQPGTYSTTVGATSASTCLPCPSGKTSNAGATSCF